MPHWMQLSKPSLWSCMRGSLTMRSTRSRRAVVRPLNSVSAMWAYGLSRLGPSGAGPSPGAIAWPALARATASSAGAWASLALVSVIGTRLRDGRDGPEELGPEVDRDVERELAGGGAQVVAAEQAGRDDQRAAAGRRAPIVTTC